MVCERIGLEKGFEFSFESGEEAGWGCGGEVMWWEEGEPREDVGVW